MVYERDLVPQCMAVELPERCYRCSFTVAKNPRQKCEIVGEFQPEPGRDGWLSLPWLNPCPGASPGYSR